MRDSRTSAGELNDARDGIFPGAQEWTEDTRLGSWYRERGEWAALVYESSDECGPAWDIRIWHHAKGFSEPGNGLMQSSIACFAPCHDIRSLEMAKGTADRMLARVAQP